MSIDPEAAKLIRLMLAKVMLVIFIVIATVTFFMVAGPGVLIGADKQPETTADQLPEKPHQKKRMAVEGEGGDIGGDLSEIFSTVDAGLSIPNLRFSGEGGQVVNLSDFKGRVVLLNVWATWCAPCVVEMPTLDALQGEFGGEDFEVVALSFDREGIEAVIRFFEETEVNNLNVYADTGHDAQNQLIWGGLPMTILIDREGNEIGRVEGPADWFSDDAKKLISDAIAGEAG